MKSILTLLIFVLIITPVSATTYFSRMVSTSSPNPSIEGQEVTFTTIVELYDPDTGESYPANGGEVGYFWPIEGPCLQVTNGTVSRTASHIAPGKYHIESLYFWFGEGIGDTYYDIDHEVLPYVQDFELTCDNQTPATYTAQFTFAECDDPKYVPPPVHFKMDTTSDAFLLTDVPENGTVKWTMPDLPPGTYSIWVSYVTGDDYPNYREFFINYQVGDTTEIPEFPSIAIPVVAVFGLIFAFGCKKE